MIVMHVFQLCACVIVVVVVMYIASVIVYVFMYDVDVLDEIEKEMQIIRARFSTRPQDKSISSYRFVCWV